MISLDEVSRQISFFKIHVVMLIIHVLTVYVLEVWVMLSVLMLDLHMTVEINLVRYPLRLKCFVMMVNVVVVSEIGVFVFLVKWLDVDVSVGMSFTESASTMVFSISAIKRVSESFFVHLRHVFAIAHVLVGMLYELSVLRSSVCYSSSLLSDGFLLNVFQVFQIFLVFQVF